MHAFNLIATFASENPIFMAVVVWPIVTGILNSILRKRTEEERAALRRDYPRYAEFVRIVGALGLDPVKFVEALKNLIMGNKTPPGPPSNPPLLPVLAAVSLCLALTGCTPQARALLVETLARKISCGIANQDLSNDELIAKCAVQSEDVKAFLDAVGESRAIGARHAVDAANIAKQDAYDKCAAGLAPKR